MADEAGRETYGDAPGWSMAQKEVPANQGVEPEAPPTSDEQAESSTAIQEPGTESATPQEATKVPEQEMPFHQHPRWIERQKEIEALREQNRQLLELAQKQQPPPVSHKDPWEGLVNHPDPATAQFYQQQRMLFQQEAERMSEQKLQGVLQAVDAGRKELAAMKIAQFRKDNPEIKPGSQEELAIAGYVQQGFDLDSAKKLSLYDKLESENRALKSKQASLPQKRAAATSEASAGIPNTAGLPPRPGDWRERAGAVLDKGGNMKDVANAIFGGKR